MPRNLISRLSGAQRRAIKKKLFRYRYLYHRKVAGKYGPEDFRLFLKARLGIEPGGHIMIHSSYESLAYWNLKATEILGILKELVTPGGIIVIPTFVTRNSREYVRERSTFNAARTPSRMGILSELFRRQRDTVRSLDPLKPFAVWGKGKEDYAGEHHLSAYSYDRKSPLFKLAENGGKVIGLGASIHYLTLVHAVEDTMGSAYPISLYGDSAHEFEVTDSNGNTLRVQKKVQDNPYADKMRIKRYCRKYLPAGITDSFTHRFTPYFTCEAGPFLKESAALAEKGITIYGRF